MNSRAKGKRGELFVAKFLRDHGYDARRGQQFSGANGDPDVIGLPFIHHEVKFVERLNIQDAYDQSKRDARPCEIPTVWHKKNYCEMLVTISAEDFMTMYKAAEDTLKTWALLDVAEERYG